MSQTILYVLAYYSNKVTIVEYKCGSHLEALCKRSKSVFGYTLSISVHSLSVCISPLLAKATLWNSVFHISAGRRSEALAKRGCKLL